MPREEPPNYSGYRDLGLPHREVREYFDFWPSAAEMLSSVRNGCHLCAITCQQRTERLNNQLNGDHPLLEHVELVPSSGPVKLVTVWTWWHPTLEANTSGSLVLAEVSRALYLEWSSNTFSNDCDQGPWLSRSGKSAYMELECFGVDATQTKGEILSQLKTDDNYHFSSPLQVSPKLGMGRDHLLSHYTGLEAVLNLAHKWIRTCHTEHSCHMDSKASVPGMPFRPTRLLDVGNSDGVQDPRLLIKGHDSSPVEYLALSHCWGHRSHNFYKLTPITEQKLLRGVRVEKLSRTFQDAVKVCRKLKRRFIWIDSLCIKQGSMDDWVREAAQIHLVYAHSYCTIAAVCDHWGGGGFLRSRNPRGRPRLSHQF